MKTYEVRNGSRLVVITENSPKRFSARLYLNNGDTASLQNWKGATKAGAEKWAARMLNH